MLQLGIRGLGIARFKFNPISWFLKGEQGAWYDPSDLTTLFQDSAGTTPVTAVEQPVGLMKDKSGRGNHAFQATAGNRPVLSARVNLLTKTEDFSDAVWTKTGSTISNSTIDTPEGTQLTAKLIGNNTSTTCYTTQFYTSIGTAYTCTIYAKAANTPRVSIWEGNSSAFYSTFDLISGTVVANSGATGSISSIGNGWFKCSMTSTQTSGTRGFYTVLIGALGTGPFATGFSGDGVSGIYIWHPDLRPTNSGALLPPYQRVNTESDYDTVGFPLYLKANGTSSAMSTNSIDFTGTDKMTVVTGVRKLSDATAAILFELSVVSPNNKGFYVAAPQANLTANYSYLSAGTIAYEAIASPFVAPTPNVVTGQSSISTPSSTIRVNSNQAAISSSTLGTGNFGNSPLYLFARAGISLYLNGQFYGAIIRGAQSDTASVTQTENYMATKTGITF